MSEEWRIYRNESPPGEPQAADWGADWEVPAPPWRDWRKSRGLPQDGRLIAPDPGEPAEKIYSRASPEIILTVNAALRLRRPILVTGAPGTGKTSLAYSVAY